MARTRTKLTSGQVAKVLDFERRTVTNWARLGLLASEQSAGGQYRFTVSVVRAFAKKQGLTCDWDKLGSRADAKPVKRARRRGK